MKSTYICPKCDERFKTFYHPHTTTVSELGHQNPCDSRMEEFISKQDIIKWAEQRLKIDMEFLKLYPDAEQTKGHAAGMQNLIISLERYEDMA